MKKLVTPPNMVDTPQPVPDRVQINLKPSELDDVTCDKCGNYTFQRVVLIKRLSPLQSPTGKEAHVPVEVFSCAVCNHINSSLIKELAGWFKRKEEPRENSTSETTQTKNETQQPSPIESSPPSPSPDGIVETKLDLEETY
jgi:hypothetical protein